MITQVYKIGRGGDGGGIKKQIQGYLFLTYFFALSPKMKPIFILNVRLFHKFEKNVFSKNYFSPQKLYMWNQFPLIDTCLGIQT